MHYFLKKKYSSNLSFQDIWKSVNFKSNIDIEKNIDCNKETQYFNNKPVLQNLLAENHQVITKEIDYSYFNQISVSEIDTTNLYECFQGILAYILYYSENKFNIKELEFFFSGAKNYNRSTSVKKPYKANIMNIFNYDKYNYQLDIENVNEAYFGLTFKRIQIQPQAYSIRFGSKSNSSSNLICFTFEAFDENLKKWDILDERINTNELTKDGSFALFYVHLNGKNYSSFKITQKEPGTNGFWGFSIAGFDIHGIVSLRENMVDVQNENLTDNQKNNIDVVEYDPIIDMASFLF